MPKNTAALTKYETPLGASLRRRRKQLGLTMQFVADRAGLSAGFISQIERGLAAPSLSSLVALAEVLDTHISSFLDQPKGLNTSTHKKNRTTYSVPGAEPCYERLSSAFKGSTLHSVIIHEPPGHRAVPISHRGEEMFYIVRGEVTVEIESERQILRQGDSVHFDSHKVHSTWNHTSEVVEILWCGTMDIFGEAPAPIHKMTSLAMVENNQATNKEPKK